MTLDLAQGAAHLRSTGLLPRLRGDDAADPALRGQATLTTIVGRLANLLPIVRNTVYIPNARFSNSIKSVGPALCPDYDDEGHCLWRTALFQLASGSLSDPAEIDLRWSRCIALCCVWLRIWMADAPIDAGMVGPFWVVEERGSAIVIAHGVPLAQAEPYGDMLTVDTGHFEYWTALARHGAQALRTAGLPTAPAWSEYEEWPRGRVLYDRTARRFVIRADRQLHHPAFVRHIVDRFGIGALNPLVLPDDHYQSVRRVPLPAPRAAITATRSAPQVIKPKAD